MNIYNSLYPSLKYYKKLAKKGPNASVHWSSAIPQPPVAQTTPTVLSSPEPVITKPDTSELSVTAPAPVVDEPVPVVDEPAPVESVDEPVVDEPVVVKKRVGRPRMAPKPKPKSKSKVDVADAKKFGANMTMEARKEAFMNRISKKSVAKADKEVEELHQVLDTVGHSEEQLNKETKELRKKIRLINTSKLFLHHSNIEKSDVIDTLTSEDDSN